MQKQESSQQPVVLVDDESSILLSSKMVLASAGIRGVETVEDSRELMPLLARREAAVVVLDLFMPYMSGTQLLPEIVREYPDLPVIVMTATQEVADFLWVRHGDLGSKEIEALIDIRGGAGYLEVVDVNDKQTLEFRVPEAAAPLIAPAHGYGAFFLDDRLAVLLPVPAAVGMTVQGEHERADRIGEVGPGIGLPVFGQSDPCLLAFSALFECKPVWRRPAWSCYHAASRTRHRTYRLPWPQGSWTVRRR